MSGPGVAIELTAVIFAAEEEKAFVLAAAPGADEAPRLPSGAFDPVGDRTFELALRAFVLAQTGFELGYVEQLYTFGDRDREAPPRPGATLRAISIGYLALARAPIDAPTGRWSPWYRFFPWEDWRAGRPALLDRVIAPGLRAWADSAGGQARRAARWDRARATFGLDGADWNEERVLDRYELLYEAGLVLEAESCGDPGLGERMAADHRRILATAVQRLRGKVKYRPVLFELMPDAFTLSALQVVAETVLGLRLHKQNFRRALAASGLVTGTGRLETATGGRPAELHRFNREALRDRPALGVPAPRIREASD